MHKIAIAMHMVTLAMAVETKQNTFENASLYNAH